MFFILITLKDVELDLSILLGSLHLDFLHCQEFNDNVDLFVLLETTEHGLNSENLLSFLAEVKVKLNGVLALVLQEKSEFLRLANSNGFKVEDLFDLHLLIKSDVESFRVKSDGLLILLDAK